MNSQNNSSEKLDVYQLVTNQIIQRLEAGVIPWQKPWADAGMPMNLISKRPYRGINLWLLNTLPYERNLYLTWDQLKKIGGSVKQGEHGQIVVFWKQVKKQSEEMDSADKPKQAPLLRYYKVFNVAQCRDIPVDLVPEMHKDDVIPIQECEAIISTMPSCPEIKHKEQKAFYHIEQDYINMPKKKSFKTPESYYSTIFHELVHSTGAEKRLGRASITEMSEFGSPAYSIEELIAELGAAYLCSFSGILPKEIENSVAYISGWLEQLKNDKRFIVTASGQAQKAADLILNRQDNASKDEVVEPIDESVIS